MNLKDVQPTLTRNKSHCINNKVWMFWFNRNINTNEQKEKEEKVSAYLLITRTRTRRRKGNVLVSKINLKSDQESEKKLI